MITKLNELKTSFKFIKNTVQKSKFALSFVFIRVPIRSTLCFFKYKEKKVFWQ